MSAPEKRRRGRGGRSKDSHPRPAESGPPEPTRVPALQWIAACAAVFAAALFLYIPTGRFEFVSWDDSHYVTQNPWIRGFTAENLRHVFTKTYFVSYMPLQLVSYMADYSLWGLKPSGYHLHSVLLNAINAVLALILVRRLFGSFALAFAAALLFAVHPSHVESVAWVSARKDVLSTLFLFPSVYFYLRARRERSLRAGPFALSVALFALAVLSKVNVVVMPAFLILIDLVWLKTSRRGARFWLHSFATKIPYGAAGLAVAIVNWIVEVKTKAPYASDPLHYLALKGYAAWSYLGILTGFVRQNPIYDTPGLTMDVLPVAANLAGLLVLPAVFWVAYPRRYRVVALGAGWMFVMLLPAIFFPVPTLVADRYLYTPALGFCWMLAAGLLRLGRIVTLPPLRAGAAIALVALAAGFFTFRTARYSRVWANSESLWSYTIERSVDFRAYNNLARVRMDQNRWTEAERYFRLGSRQPNVTSNDGLTAVYYKQGRYPEALAASDKAIRLYGLKEENPTEFAELQYKRGAVLWALSRLEEAVAAWEAALRADPRHAAARTMLTQARQYVPATR